MSTAGAVAGLLLSGCAGRTEAPIAANAATDTASASLAIPEDLRAEVEKAAATGAQLYLLDKASAIGTDVLLQETGGPPKGLAGWITVREADEQDRPLPSFRVKFLTAEPKPRVGYEIHVPIEPGWTRSTPY